MNRSNRKIQFAIVVALIAFSLGCTKKSEIPEPYAEGNENFELIDIFKNDLNYTIEISQRQTIKLLEELTIKLYQRNPNQIKKEFDYTVEDVVELIQNNRIPASKGKMIAQLGNYRSQELIKLSVHPRFKNDRVLAFVYGLRNMITSSYGSENFYFINQVEPQKIFNLARNLEISFWYLFNSVDDKNRPYIMSLSLDPRNLNVSYERIAGKMIQIQDLLSEVTSKAYGKNLTKQWIDFSKAFYFII